MRRRDACAALLLLPGCRSSQPPAVAIPAEKPRYPVLVQLGAERDRFFATRDPELVFSVFYYHVTKSLLHEIRDRRSPEPGILLELLNGFFAVWEGSRSGKCRPDHWKPYFFRAEQLRRRGSVRWRDVAHPLDRVRPISLPALGVAAHIDGDLPVCVVEVMRRHPEVRGARLAAFEASFSALDPVFEGALHQAFEDLAPHIPGAPGPAMRAWQSRFAARIVVAKRHRAWNAARRQLSGAG